MKKQLLKKHVFLTAFLFLYALGGSAQIYLSPSGNDGNDGKSPANAKATLAAAVAAVGSETVPYIKLSAGTFITGSVAIPQNVRVVGEGAGQTIINVTSNSIALQSGSALSNVTITRPVPSVSGGVPTISVSTYSGSTGITIKNCRFTGNRTAIYLQGSNHIIANNEFEDNRTGLLVDPSGSPSVTGLVLERNRFYNNRSFGVIFLGGADGNTDANAVTARIGYNDFIGNLAGGIELNVQNAATAVTLVRNYFDETNNAILASRTNGGFTVNDHDQSLPNFTDNNPAADYPNAVSGSATNKITLSGSLNAASANGFSFENSLISSTSPAFAGYIFIQDAINYSNAGATLSVTAGTFNELVVVNKALTIDGLDYTKTKVTYAGTVGVGVTPTLFKVTASNVVIKNIRFNVDLAIVHSAILTSGLISNILIKNNDIVATRTASTGPAYGLRNAIALNPNITITGATHINNPNNGPTNYTVEDNKVSGTTAAENGIADAFFRAGMQVDRIDGYSIQNNIFNASVNHDVVTRFLVGGDASIKGNTFKGGGLEVSSSTNTAGKLTIDNNIFDGGYSKQAPWAMLRLRINNAHREVIVSNNNFIDQKLAASVEDFRDVTFESNTFTPTVNGFRLLNFNTKAATTGPSFPLQQIGAKLYSNTFNGLVGATTGSAITFANFDQDGNNNYLSGTYEIGAVGKQNIFNDDIPTFIAINNSNGVLTSNAGFKSAYEEYNDNYYVSTTGYWAKDIRADENQFFIDGQLREPFSLTTVQKTVLDGKIMDKKDDPNIAEVQYYFPVSNVTTGVEYATIQLAIDAATAGDEIKVTEGTYAEKIIINKRLTIKGPNVGVSGIGTRVAEAKIVPNAVDLSGASANLVLFAAGSDGSIFDGFEVNGNNPALTSGIVVKGEDIDAPFGVGIEDAGNITIQNNIVKNYTSTETSPFPWAYGIHSSPNDATVYSGIIIKNNYVGNIQTAAVAAFVGILIEQNSYAQVSYNKVEDVRTGIQLGNAYRANPAAATFEASIDNNIIIASRGVYYNLLYQDASPWYVRNNTISSATLNGAATTFTGIRMESLQGTYSGYITDNTIDGEYANRIAENASFDGTGIWFNNEINTTGMLLLKDNNIANVNNGIVYSASGTSQLTNKVRFVGGNIENVQNNYVRYIIPSGTPTFADINLPTTKLDGKTGDQYTPTELSNIFTSKIIDKDDNPAYGKVNLLFNVVNITQGTAFATIQAAIDDVLTQNADIIDVKEGTYTLTTGVQINKGITLQGNSNNLLAKPIITGVGNVTNKSLIEIDAPNVTIKNFEFQIAQDGNALNGIASLTTDNFHNLTIADNIFKGTKAQSGTGFVWTSHAIKLGRGSIGVVVPNNLVNIVRNQITYANLAAPEFFGRGIYAFNTYGKIGGAGADKNTIVAVYALQGGEIGGGTGKDFEFSYNDVPLGLVSVVGAEVGNHKISNNNIGYGIANMTQANAVVRSLEVKGSRTANANIEVSSNTITKYANIGIFIQRSNNVTIKNNTLTPFVDVTNTAFRSIVFSSKEGTSGAQSAATSEKLSISGNTFNGTGGTGIVFLNDNASASVRPLTDAKIGGLNADKNTFASTLGSYIVLDATPSGTTTSLALLYDVAQTGTNTTNILPFNGDIDAAYNVFGSIDSETETNFDNLVAVKAKIIDGVDNGLTGYVNIQPNKAFIATLADLPNALATVPDHFTLLLKNNAAIYANLGNATVTKAHTFAIDQYTTGEITFANLTLNALSKEVTFNQAAHVTGNFVVTEGKVNATTGLTLDGSKAITFDFNKPANFVNGKIKLLNVNAGNNISMFVGKGNVSTAVGLLEVAGTTSDFEIEYFPTGYANTTSFNPVVLGLIHNKEHWSINRLSGTAQAKVGLTTFDFLNSGFTSFISANATIARFDLGGGTWVDAGNTFNAVNLNMGSIASGLNADFGVFTFAKTPLVVLPVSLVSFTVEATAGGALAKWSTGAERNNAKFELEKSDDGKNFHKIGEREGKGTTSSVSNYQFLDAGFKTSAYYRLTQLDGDGKKTVYEQLIRFVKGLDAGLTITAYPNPTTSKLFVNVGKVSNEKVKLNLVDVSGRVRQTLNASALGLIEFDVSHVNPGVYTLQILKDSGNVSKKIVKQ